MNRRTLLRGFAAAGTLSLTAGCLADDSPGEGPIDTGEPTDDETPTDTSVPTDTLSESPDTTPSNTPTGTDDHVDTVSGTTRRPNPSDTPGGGSGDSFAVTGSSCGAQVDEASVSFSDSSVTVIGTIWGNDACYTATLSETRYEGDTFTVVVASESDAGTDTMCAQCITEIQYEATIAVDGALPDRVEVKHDHDGTLTTVATVDR